MHAPIVADAAAAAVAAVRRRADELAGPGRVRIAAAVKYVDPGDLAVVVGAGVDVLAESRLDALEAGQAALAAAGTPTSAEWHFIGRLQSRQVPRIAPRVHLLHTLASVSAARRLGDLAAAGAPVPGVLVQVNTAADPAKDGVAPDELPAFLDALPDGVRVHGLMTMPAAAPGDPTASRAAFRSLAELCSSERARTCEADAAAGRPLRHPLDELSMGTSQDWEVAVEEGATLVRLGQVLFGG